MLRNVIPPPGPPRVLAIAQLTSTIGDGLYYVCAALYFTRVVGLSPVQFGLGLTIAWTIGLVAGVPLGHLADRRGPRGTAAMLYVGAGVAIAAYLFVSSLPLFIAAACLYAVCARGGSAAQQALLAGLVDKSRITETRAYMQSTYNAGLSIGAALAGAALLVDTDRAYLAAFAVNALTFLVAALVLFGVPAMSPSAAPAPGEPQMAVLRDRPYTVITMINLLMILHVPLIDVALPLWVAQHTEAPLWIVSAMFVLNTAAVVLTQVRVARGVTSMASAQRFVLRSGAILLVACAVFAFSAAGTSPWTAGVLLLLATGVMTVGEMMQSAAMWEISFGLAPSDKHGQYQGFFGIGLTGAEILGPLLLTGLVVYGGPTGWLVLGALFMLASVGMGPAVRWAERTRLRASIQDIATVLSPSSPRPPRMSA